MRIGSGVQSASEVFGKQQNNSKTYVAENEAFSQTSVKVYLKTDDMLFSGGNGTGLSFYIKYAEESTEDNPVVIAKGVDENGKEFEEKININDINLRNASYVEMSALEAYYNVDKGNSFDVIGASPEECYGYAGPVGKSGSETANDGESWWEKRHERMEELMKEQEKEAVKRAQARRKAVQNEYLNSQLVAAAYEKSSIILPDNPVIL